MQAAAISTRTVACKAATQHPFSAPSATASVSACSKAGSRLLPLPARDAIAGVNALGDVAPHDAVLTDLAQMQARFESDARYADRVYAVYSRLLKRASCRRSQTATSSSYCSRNTNICRPLPPSPCAHTHTHTPSPAPRALLPLQRRPSAR